ncbi:hypothetical protein Rsub_00432 [Raphidocelis subcapitata]|uniref:Uncharacterized protein n=1 Tax=Raphidocelis subcapitata TaxID=307507 RepID=A0A2V0NKA2_9CHLO|nr:hypothetical protein Rsub_00432 [Raphidocelis subcapitata]|eukprot:GBF87721.1 hypothetical protein Rsub_00432 [Raphidocelis subcapitata]
MLGDLDLIHMARDRAMHSCAAPAADLPAGDPRGLSRLSIDSAFSVSSASTGASGSLSSSWCGFGAASPKATSALFRQASLPAPSSAPVDIPGRAGGGRASADYGLLRRHNTVGAGYPVSASAGPSSFGGGALPAAAAAAAAASAAFAAGAGAGGPGAASEAAARPRLPLLVRSLSKGLSQSMDFR